MMKSQLYSQHFTVIVCKVKVIHAVSFNRQNYYNHAKSTHDHLVSHQHQHQHYHQCVHIRKYEKKSCYCPIDFIPPLLPNEARNATKDQLQTVSRNVGCHGTCEKIVCQIVFRNIIRMLLKLKRK